MTGSVKQIAFANDIVKEWVNHAEEKKGFFMGKGPSEAAKKLLDRAMDILQKRIKEEDNAGEIIANRYAKKFDYEAIFYALMKGEIN